MSDVQGPALPPKTKALKKLQAAAKTCLVCNFAKKSTQTVFGEGSKTAGLMLVGEVPGDVEDRTGHPFTGPAGRLLNQILAELKVDPAHIYVTNAVKHFKFVQKGKRRLHQKPNSNEMHACRPWLQSEIHALKPQVILALGLTAAVSLTDRPVKITKERGQWTTSPLSTAKVLLTWHPSAILRSPDKEQRDQMREEFKKDLKKAYSSLKFDA